MAAWEEWDMENIQTRTRAKSSIAPSKEDVRAVLKIINGLDKVQDVAPHSVSGKCWFYSKVFFQRTPWVTCVAWVTLTITFSMTMAATISIQTDLQRYSFGWKSVLSKLFQLTNDKGDQIALLCTCIVINLIMYLFALLGSQACLAKRCSKWGENFVCSLYFLRMFELVLFLACCVCLFIVLYDGACLIANSSTIAALKAVCDGSDNFIPVYTQLISRDSIVSAFLKLQSVDMEYINGFCDDVDSMRNSLSQSWYTNFFALVAQIILTFCGYQNYMITQAVWESSVYGSDLEKELEKRRSELEIATEMKKKQKEGKKAARASLELELTSKRFPELQHADSSRSSDKFDDSKRESAYSTTPGYFDDQEGEHTGGGYFEPLSESKRQSNGAFDGGEWWNQSGPMD